MPNDRDILGVYIPDRISQLSNQEILDKIAQLQAHREAILAELAATKRASVYKPRKEKILDLTKLDADDVLTVLAAQMGISVDEFKRLAGTK